MATLEKIRSKAALLLIVVGVALFAFIIGDFLRSGSTFFQQKQENIIVVDGEEVHYHDFTNKVEERLNAYKRSGQTLTDDENHQVRQDVLNSLIDDILIDKETEKLGLALTKKEVYDMIMGDNISPIIMQMPAFQNPATGQFDKSALIYFLQMIESDDLDEYPEETAYQIREQKAQWLTAEREIMKNRLRSKFTTLLSSSILTNEADAKMAFDNKKVSVDFNYVSQSFNAIPDSEVEVTDAEIQKRYNETKAQYKQEEAKVINYIAVNIVPDPNDFKSAEAKFDAIRENFSTAANVSELVQFNSDVPFVDAYQSFSSLNTDLKNFVGNNTIGSVEGPVRKGNTFHLYKLIDEKTGSDSIKVNLLPLPMAVSDEALNVVTDSLIRVVKNGTPFSEMASAATGGQMNGDMGWVTEMELAKEIDSAFKNQLFDAKTNELFIAQSAMGSKFLVQITEKTAPVKKYKIADIQTTVTPSQETKTRLYNELSQFTATNHSLSAMKEKASEAGYNIRTDVEILKNQINIDGIQNTRQLIQWAFNNKNGAISDITECQNGEYFVVAAVQDYLPEGYRTLASVSDLLKREIMNEKKAEKIVSNLKAKNLTTLEQYAEAMNSTVQEVKFVTFETGSISGIGNEPILSAEAPLAPVGEVSGPYIGQRRVYAIYVTDKKASEETFNAEEQIKRTQMQNTMRVQYQLMQSASTLLKEKAKIDNNFNRFF